MMKNHPDRFKGLRAKYEADGDKILLEILKDKILQAEEDCKLINDAYKVLSDPTLRRAYDKRLNEVAVSVPEIVISPTKIDFGVLKEGQKKSKNFTIQNKGGPAVAVEINWENKPDWGEIIIEPDPDEIFPIKVTIEVNTTGVDPSSESQKVLVNIDGQNYAIDTQLTIEKTPFLTSVPPTITKSTLSKSTKTKSTLTLFAWWFGFAIIVLGFAFGIIANNTMNTTPYKQLEDNYEQISTQASRSELKEELTLFEANPEKLVTIKKVRDGIGKENAQKMTANFPLNTKLPIIRDFQK